MDDTNNNNKDYLNLNNTESINVNRMWSYLFLIFGILSLINTIISISIDFLNIQFPINNITTNIFLLYSSVFTIVTNILTLFPIIYVIITYLIIEINLKKNSGSINRFFILKVLALAALWKIIPGLFDLLLSPYYNILRLKMGSIYQGINYQYFVNSVDIILTMIIALLITYILINNYFAKNKNLE